jgi:hypothetical protein
VSGQFCFNRVEPGDYQLTTQARDFRLDRRRVAVQAEKSERLTIALSLETVTQQVTVAEGTADTNSINVAQTQVNQGLIQNLPSESVNARVSSILTLATPGVAADSNGVSIRLVNTRKHPLA